jgi:hypothetical protein
MENSAFHKPLFLVVGDTCFFYFPIFLDVNDINETKRTVVGFSSSMDSQ